MESRESLPGYQSLISVSSIMYQDFEYPSDMTLQNFYNFICLL